QTISCHILLNPCTRNDSHRNYLLITFPRGTDVAKVLNIAIAFAITYNRV
ncbi:hypothetical protein BDR04DRAFT_1092429, partial [Suillus decipiens]